MVEIIPEQQQESLPNLERPLIMRTSAQRLDFPIQAALDAIIYSKLLESSELSTVAGDGGQNSETTLIQLCACLYLAAKVNEFELVKIRDIINVVQFTMTQGVYDPQQQGDDAEDEDMLDD